MRGEGASSAVSNYLEAPNTADEPNQLQVSTALVRGLADVIRQRMKAAQGASLGEIDAICNEAEERMFPLSQLRALLAQAVRKTGEPALGLHWGKHASPSSFGLMTPLISYAPTLRHALALVAQFHSLITEGARFQLEERVGVARLYCDLPPGMNTTELTLVEMMQAGLVRMFEEFGCVGQDIRAVCFEYARPAHYAAYASAFGGVARFHQSYTGIEFAAAALDRSHMHRHSELQALMISEAQRSLERRGAPRRFADRVLSLLRSAEPRQLPDMNDISRRLGIGERTLRRRLESEGTSYRELTQIILYEAARSMLRNADLTIQAVAGALGFEDTTAFHRAFRRWSDITPSEYRESASAIRRPSLPAALYNASDR